MHTNWALPSGYFVHFLATHRRGASNYQQAIAVAENVGMYHASACQHLWDKDNK